MEMKQKPKIVIDTQRETETPIFSLTIGAIHTKIDLSCIDLRSISVRFEKVFTLI